MTTRYRDYEDSDLLVAVARQAGVPADLVVHPDQVCSARDRDAVTWVEFFRGRKGDPIGRVCMDVDTAGKVALPSRRGPQPQHGELWAVRVVGATRSGRAIIVRLLRKLSWAEVEAEARRQAKAREEASARKRAEDKRRALDAIASAFGSASWEDFQREFARAAERLGLGDRLGLEVSEVDTYNWAVSVAVTVTYPDGDFSRVAIGPETPAKMRRLATEVPADDAPHYARRVHAFWKEVYPVAVERLRGGALAVAWVLGSTLYWGEPRRMLLEVVALNP